MNRVTVAAVICTQQHLSLAVEVRSRDNLETSRSLLGLEPYKHLVLQVHY